MDINLYKRDSVEKRVLLEFEHLTLTNDDIREDMTLTEQVNTEADITAGACCSVQLSFSVLNLHQHITKADLVGKEFRYRAGAQTGENDVWREMARRGLYLAVRSGDFWYGVNAHGTGLNIWHGEEQQIAPTQPAQPVKSILLKDGMLYCGHETAPYATAYIIESDGNLTPMEFTPSAIEIEKIQRYNARQSALNLTGDILLDYKKEWRDGAVYACMERVIAFNHIGYFTPDSVDRKNDNLLSVSAYDRMTKFDSAADSYLDGLTYPVTLLAFLKGLCAFYGVVLATTNFPNSGYLVQQNIKTANLPGRQLLQWVAQAAVRFARFDPFGRLALNWYTETGYTLTAGNYTTLEVSEYDTAPIDKAQVRGTADDIGVIVGNGENTYVIENNPLFYANTDAELRDAVEAVFTQVDGVSYTPYRVKCRGNPLIRAGDIITIESRKGQLVQARIMSRTLKGVRALSDSYEATGNQIRATQNDWQNQQIAQLRGKINEVSITVEGTINRLYDANTGDITQLKATATGLEITVGNQTGEISSLGQKTTQLSGDVTQLKLTTGGLSLAVSNNKLTFGTNGLSIYNGGFRIYNGNEEVFSVASDGSGIVMTGKVVTKGVWPVNGQNRNIEAELSAGGLKFYEANTSGNMNMVGRIYGYDGYMNLMGWLTIEKARTIRVDSLWVHSIHGFSPSSEMAEDQVDTIFVKNLDVRFAKFGDGTVISGSQYTTVVTGVVFNSVTQTITVATQQIRTVH